MLFFGRALILGPLCAALLLACGSKVNPLGNYPSVLPAALDGGPVEAAVPPSFTYQIMPLLKKSCLCHVQGAETPLLDTYTHVVANAAASLQAMDDGIMPPSGPLPGSDIDLLRSWIAAGTPNT